MSSGITEARAFAPASVGNIAVGFDLLGHSIEGLRDVATVADEAGEPTAGAALLPDGLAQAGSQPPHQSQADGERQRCPCQLRIPDDEDDHR